jgi:TetR/AcrR family transcriptional regulator, cholesterol catabolism regulator
VTRAGLLNKPDIVTAAVAGRRKVTAAQADTPPIKKRIEDPALVERRRAQLIDAAIVCFSKHGYHSTTMRDVAARADISVGLIYQYFEDKEDLLFLALKEVLASYKRQIPIALKNVTDPLERFCAAVRSYCRVNDSSIEATVLAYRETKSLSRERRDVIKQLELNTNKLITTCIRDCIKAGLFDEIDVELFTYQIVMFSHTWALKAWRFTRRMTVDEYVDRGLQLMLNPVLTKTGRQRMPPPGRRK